MRAMILAAGLGTRMRPLTDALPKPLVPLLDRPLLRYHLEMLKSVGVEEVVLNLHHLPEAIPAALSDGRALGMRLQYSLEPELLGTGGGVKKVASFLTEPGGPFLLLNGDLLIEVNLAEVLAAHRASGAVATMVLREDPRLTQFGALGTDANGRILDFVGRARAAGEVTRRGLFTGVHVLEPEVLTLLPDGPCCINQTAYPALVRADRHVQAYFQTGFWSDVGTPERYLEAALALLERSFTPAGASPLSDAAFAVVGGETMGSAAAVAGLEATEVTGNLWCAPGVTLAAGTRLENVVIGRGASIGPRCALSNSVIWPGATVPPDTRLDQAVVWVQHGQTQLWQTKA